MKKKVIHAMTALLVFTGLSLPLVGLTWLSAGQSETAAAGEDEHAHHETECHEAECEHLHGRAETHQPLGLDELFAMTCEHEGPIVECDECRYEVGVARIDPSLSEGLVESVRVSVQVLTADSLRLNGEVDLDPTRVLDVASPARGRIDRVHKVLGDTVAPMDPLLVVRSSDFGQAQADFSVASAELDLARQIYEREKRLRDTQVGSEADYQDAAKRLAGARAAWAAAYERLELFGLDEEQIETLRTENERAFGELVLRAPGAGTIIMHSAVRGQFIDASDTPYRIADLSAVWIWCDVYEADLAAVHDRLASGDGAPVEVRAPAFGGTVFHGVADMIGSRLDPATRTVKMRVRADNPGGRLKPGMFVTVSLGLGGSRTAMRVPETAVLSDAGRHFVFARLSDELWVRRDVSVGPTGAGFVEVASGLGDGDVIATKGAFMFKSEILKEKMGAGCAH
jgi:cobalt-zinc-cadmium efflux system membrane fusion protein